jgi:hypothetical protein
MSRLPVNFNHCASSLRVIVAFLHAVAIGIFIALLAFVAFVAV